MQVLLDGLEHGVSPILVIQERGHTWIGSATEMEDRIATGTNFRN